MDIAIMLLTEVKLKSQSVKCSVVFFQSAITWSVLRERPSLRYAVIVVLAEPVPIMVSPPVPPTVSR